jgi:hypothetical protein
MTRPTLRLVVDNGEPVRSAADDDRGEESTKFVPIRLLLALSGRCDCTECCAVELARRAGRTWVHPDVRERRPWIHAVR